MKILETERLLLRTMDEGDYEALCLILQDPEVMYAYAHAFTDEEVRLWLHRQQERYARDGFGLWAVVLKESGTMIGQCGLTLQPCDGRTMVEVGYLFRKAYWHRGYATEAAIACKRHAFSLPGISEVCSIIRGRRPAQRHDTPQHVHETLLRHGHAPLCLHHVPRGLVSRVKPQSLPLFIGFSDKVSYFCPERYKTKHL